MDNKLQILTDKLYQEGVEKGKNEASTLIEKAKQEKEIIIREAEKEAEKIILDAQKNAAETKKNGEAELKLYAGQALESLKSEITNLISDKIVSEAVSPAIQDKDFIQEIILKLISNWPSGETPVISTSDANSLKELFESKAKKAMDQGILIEQVNGKPGNFSIAPSNGSYKINFNEEGIIEYFKSFIRPHLVNYLF